MKKNNFLLLFFMVVLFNSSIGQTAIAPSGSGTAGDPYLIATLNNLYWVTQNSSSWTSHFIQTSNIDASSTSSWHGGDGFSPIGNTSSNFRGSFNGQGYTIKNLYINRPTTDYVGFFGYTRDVTLLNIALVNASITGQHTVGALVGSLTVASNVSYCYATGTVNAGLNGSNSTVGGLIGYANGSISYCYSSCNVNGKKMAGGFVGQAVNTTILSCYSTGNVLIDGSGSNTYAGGFFSIQEGSTSVCSNCYAIGNVTNSASGGSAYAASFAGANVNSFVNCYGIGVVSAVNTARGFTSRNIGGSTTNCFYGETTGQTSDANTATRKTTAEMKTTSTFTNAGWDFVGETTNGSNNYWDRSDVINNGYPFLTFEIPVPPIAWTGSSNTNWSNADNWSTTEVPNSTDNIVIPNTVRKPIVSSIAQCKNITIDADALLTISPTYSITIHGSLENNGTFTIKSNSSGDGSLIVNGNVSGSGIYKVERYLAANKWHLVSSPITNAMSGIFAGIWLRPYDETTNAFGAYITPTSVPLAPGQGFSNWTYNNEVRTFSGIVNNGTVGPINLARTNLGWNLIGNPYPSAIDWDAATGWTKTNVANSVYVWNGTLGNYATYIGGAGNNGGSRYISMGQGFFVQAQAGGGSISMNNNVRVHNSVAFMKNDDPANIIRIKVATAESSDETVIAIRSEVMDEFDYQFDATKFRGDASAPQLYTKKADTEAAICAYSEVDKVTGKFVSLEPAQYTEHVLLYTHTLDGNKIPQLYDHVTQTLIYPNVPFTFTPSENDPIHRFEFKEPAITAIHESANSSIMVWESNGTLYIDNLGDEIVKEVRVFDMQGKLVYVGNQLRNDVSHLSKGVYVVNIMTGNRLLNIKITLR